MAIPQTAMQKLKDAAWSKYGRLYETKLTGENGQPLYSLDVGQGELIYVSNVGVRTAPPDVLAKLNAGQAVDQSLVYFRTVPKMETAAPGLQWLTRSIFVCTGERYPDAVVIRFWRVL